MSLQLYNSQLWNLDITAVGLTTKQNRKLSVPDLKPKGNLANLSSTNKHSRTLVTNTRQINNLNRYSYMRLRRLCCYSICHENAAFFNINRVIIGYFDYCEIAFLVLWQCKQKKPIALQSTRLLCEYYV